MGPDLTDKRWIVAKGILFAVLALLAGLLQILTEESLWQEALLLVICVWASCRFYYFLFHCLQAYVDPGLKSAGVMDLVGRLFRKGMCRMPVIVRSGELEHISDGWPSLDEKRTRKLRCMCARIAVLLSLVAAGIALVAVELYIGEFVSVPLVAHLGLLAEQLEAPVLLLLLNGLICYCGYAGKQVPRWLVLLGWLGVFGLVWQSGKSSHNLSHVMFQACSGYSELVLKLGLPIALLITSVWLLEFRVLRGRYIIIRYQKFQISRNGRRGLALLCILACWMGTLWYFDIF